MCYIRPLLNFVFGGGGDKQFQLLRNAGTKFEFARVDSQTPVLVGFSVVPCAMRELARRQEDSVALAATRALG